MINVARANKRDRAGVIDAARVRVNAFVQLG